jgi:hypothetical protein
VVERGGRKQPSRLDKPLRGRRIDRFETADRVLGIDAVKVAYAPRLAVFCGRPKRMRVEGPIRVGGAVRDDEYNPATE